MKAAVLYKANEQTSDLATSSRRGPARAKRA